MKNYSFIPDETYYGEAQALYIALFNNPQPSDSSGLAYWETQLAAYPTDAVNAFSTYATFYGGQPLSSSNIENGINTIYQDIIGVSATSGAQQYWASEWIGDGGTLTIGEIVMAIYDYMESIPTTSPGYAEYTEKMENKIFNYYDEAQALYIGLLNSTPTSNGLNYWENSLASNQTAALNAISNYVTYNGQALSSSNIDSEIVNIYKNLEGNTSVTSSSSGVQYWASQWTGNGGTLSIGQILAAIYDAVENLSSTNVYYQSMNNNISTGNAAASFSYTLGIISGGGGSPDAVVINGAGTSSSSLAYTNAPGDTFILQTNVYSLALDDTSYNHTANVIMEGVVLGTLSLSPDDSNINIDLAGQAARNLIESINYTGGGAQNQTITLGVFNSSANNPASASLLIGVQDKADSGIGLNDGSSMYINGSSANNLTLYFYDNASAPSHGVTVDASGFGGTLVLHDSNLSASASNSADTVILGSGTDGFVTNLGADTVILGSGADTVTASAVISAASGGPFTTIEGSSAGGAPINAKDAIVFAQAGPNAVNPASLPAYVISGAVSAASAISAAVSYLQGIDGYTTLDSAAWFYFGGDTYIINDYQNTDQAVKLVGTVDLSGAAGGVHTIIGI